VCVRLEARLTLHLLILFDMHCLNPLVIALSVVGQPFLYMVFACCVNVYMVSVHTGST